MPTQTTPTASGITAADIDANLPRGLFVKRGAIMAAFGLSRTDMEALVPDTFIPSPVAKFKRHRFVRSQVLEVARQWERRRSAAA
jgi:hypothetical protein